MSVTPHFADDAVTVYSGDCLTVLAELPQASLDAVVTDPPYGIRFMGQAWDGADIVGRTARGRETCPMPPGVGGPQGGYRSAAAEAGRYDLSANAAFGQWCESWARECLRVLKPGGHLLAFGGSRTWHRLASGIEDAGFEMRDSMAWLHGQGFPKSHNVSGGLGTALKPAFEPIVVARKPLAGTVAANVAEHGTGALNIDGCRVGSEPRTNPAGSASSLQRVSRVQQGYRDNLTNSVGEASTVTGRWPTNVLLDDAAAEVLDAQSGVSRDGVAVNRNRPVGSDKHQNVYGRSKVHTGIDAGYGGEGGASRFFPTFRYAAKASGAERPTVNGVAHPTVKPLELMRWLIRLVTPPGGVVLDPFGGSGTTAEAAVLEHRRAVLIEREPTYLPLIVARLTKPMAVGFNFEAGT